MAKYVGGKPEERPEGRQVVLYGAPFVGKTTTLANPELNVHLCDMDHNTSPLDSADNVTIYPVDSFEEYLEFKKSHERGYYVVNGTKIPCDDADVVTFDGFTRFEELIKKWVTNSFAPNRSREIKGKFGAQTDWDDLQSHEVQEVRDWQAMTRSHGFNCIWIGHDMAILNDITKQAQHIQLALQGKYASPRIMSAVDALFYMSKEAIPDKNDPKKSNIIRGLYTQQSGIIRADARMPIEKREKLAQFIPNTDWAKILPYLGWKKKQK